MIQRNRTTKHDAQDRLLALIATLENPMPQKEMARRIGRTDVWLRRNVKELVAAGRMRVLGRLMGPGGGTVYAVGPGPSVEEVPSVPGPCCPVCGRRWDDCEGTRECRQWTNRNGEVE